jgi:AraC family transcriptional regulator
MQTTYNRQSIEAPAGRERGSQFAQYVPPALPGVEECSLENVRSAVADVLYAVSGAFQDKPEETYRYVSRAVSLLRRLEFPSVIASSDPFDAKSAAPSSPRGRLALWQVRKVSAYIESHLDSTIGSADLARLAKLSVFHFCRTFRASFGESPHTYVMRRRIERAKGMMLQSSSPLVQIANECGLADQAHLSKCFRRFVGESPAAWRRARVTPADAARKGTRSPQTIETKSDTDRGVGLREP